ncbi:hypothetical protein [Planktothrix mougeotii]|uniref:hypothetical protein n=1 Tax=Planktothrix mougeotii TaxID=54306 RepID=UPI001D13F5CB|nr:hypothetical protein [Planktothrix mougeotii]
MTSQQNRQDACLLAQKIPISYYLLPLIMQEFPQYELSNIFSLLPRRNQLYEVLKIFKRLGQIAIQSNQD